MDVLLPGDAPGFVLRPHMRVCTSSQERPRIHFCEPDVGERREEEVFGAVSLEVFHARPM